MRRLCIYLAAVVVFPLSRGRPLHLTNRTTDVGNLFAGSQLHVRNQQHSQVVLLNDIEFLTNSAHLASRCWRRGDNFIGNERPD